MVIILVLQELVVALGNLVQQFESQFAITAAQVLEEEKQKDKNSVVVAAEAPGGWNIVASHTVAGN